MEVMDNTPPSNISTSQTNFKTCVWLLCISVWIVGVVERGVAVLSHKQLSTIDVTQILIAAFFLVSWLILKPANSHVSHEGIEDH
jgi:hypothetical protein